MTKPQRLPWFLQVSSLIVAVEMSACAMVGALPVGGDSWKEEVRVHDGSTMVVTRMVKRGGRHEIGQRPSYKEQQLRFTVPGSNQTIMWEDHYSADLGQANFLPMALDIVGGTPYLVVSPMGCPSYNKWGRPNPPYVVFHYKGRGWTRIPLQELPAEITTPNMLFSEPDVQVERLGTRVISAAMIKKVIGGYKQREYRTFLRTPVKADGVSHTSCPIPTTATGKIIAPEVDGKPLEYNWWPFAAEWLKSTYGKTK